MKFKNLIILILVCIILFNFTFETTSNASTIVSGSIAAKYGVTKAAELIVFILAAMTAGVTFNALEEANKMYDNYQMWGQVEPPPNNDWKNVLIELIRFGTLSIAVGDLIANIRDYFRDKDAVEGENVVYGTLVDTQLVEFDGKSYNVSTWVDVEGRRVVLLINGHKYYFSDGAAGSRYNELISSSFHDINYHQTNSDMLTIRFYYNYYERYYDPYNMNISTSLAERSILKTDIDNVGDEIEPNSNDYKYYVKPDSIVLGNRDPFELPTWYQPNILDIVPIKEITTPEGIQETIYEGTQEELIEELINTITFEDLQQSQSIQPYNFTSTQSGTKISTGSINETPYPDIDVQPIEDTSQFQGENIGLLKSIVNWLSNIKNEIVNIGDKIDNQIEEEIEEEEPKEIDFSPITSVSLTDKFPFSLPWDLRDSISLLASEGKAPVWEIPLVTETIIIDMGEFEGIASIARVFNTLLFIISLIILTRRLI